MAFRLGSKSKENLKGVHPDIVKVVERAIEISKVDFSVVDGVRTLEKQAEYVRTGASRTMDSYHLIQEDGYSHAVDLYPWVEGKTDHSPAYYNKLGRAMFKASQELGISIEWGGLWNGFVDLPHWQLSF